MRRRKMMPTADTRIMCDAGMPTAASAPAMAPASAPTVAATSTASARGSAAALRGERYICRAHRNCERAETCRQRRNDKLGYQFLSDRTHDISFP
jgi:hypothetical protein